MSLNNNTILLLLFSMFVVSNQTSAQEIEHTGIKGKRMEAQASFKIINWDEQPFSEIDEAGKLTHVSVVKSYSGQVEGEGKLEYLMTYHKNGSADFYGVERVIGEIEGQSGSFVLHHTGTFKKGTMNQKSIVVEGSATGELEGLQGEIILSAEHQQEYPFTFNYYFQ